MQTIAHNENNVPAGRRLGDRAGSQPPPNTILPTMNPTDPTIPTPTRASRRALSLLAALALALPATAADYLVTSDLNSGLGSLRDAIHAANFTTGPHTITFDLPAGATIITLLYSDLAITSPDGITIVGPGADKLTLSGGGATRIFNIAEAARATIRGLTLKDGRTSGWADGGAIRNAGELILEDCVITASAAWSGGGIANLGTLTADRCLFRGNRTFMPFTDHPSDHGGALYNEGTATLRNSTFTGNESHRGGALYNTGSGAITLVNCTLEGNEAQYGTAINSHNSSGTVTMSFCTVTRNLAPSRVADHTAAMFGGNFNLKNCLIGGNFNSMTRSFGWLLNSPTIKGVVLTDDDHYADEGMTVVDWADVQLGDLVDNGGPTPTMALGAGSIALNAAPDATDFDGNPVTTDQRGLPRPSGVKADIGAFEYQQTLTADTEPPVVDEIEDLVIHQTGSAATTWLVTYAATGTDNATAPEDLEFTFDPPSGSAFPLGSTPVTVTATDEAGNTSDPVTFHVHVVYSDLGIQQPINANGSSVFKAGSTIPVKFKFSGASAGIPDAQAALRYQRISASTGPVNEPTTTGDPAGNSSTGFRYDAQHDQYVFNWSTRGLATGTYKLFLDLDDGTTFESELKLGK